MSGIWSQTEAPEEIEQNSDGRNLTENEREEEKKKQPDVKVKEESLPH